MIRACEIRKGNGQIQFSLSVLETTQLRRKLKVGIANPTPSFTRNRNQSFRLPSACRMVSALCTVGLVLWAIIQVWLFEY